MGTPTEREAPVAHITETLSVDLPIEEVFAYVADFANIPEWDPSIDAAHRIDSGPIAPGAAYEVVVRILGRPLTLVYRLTSREEPRSAVFTTSTALVQGRDEVTLAVDEAGRTHLTWDAEFGLRGPGRLLDPLLAPGFKVLGSRAIAGLRRELGRRAAERAAQSSATR